MVLLSRSRRRASLVFSVISTSLYRASRRFSCMMWNVGFTGLKSSMNRQWTLRNSGRLHVILLGRTSYEELSSFINHGSSLWWRTCRISIGYDSVTPLLVIVSLGEEGFRSDQIHGRTWCVVSVIFLVGRIRYPQLSSFALLLFFAEGASFRESSLCLL